MRGEAERLAASYILPIRQNAGEESPDLDDYLNDLAEVVEVIVVDASAPDIFNRNEDAWQVSAHVTPDPQLRTINGKVWGVLTGLALASHDKVIVADDDIRYDVDCLGRLVRLLDDAEVVRPQNYFDPMPWHARWDTARSLLNRATGGDWPGTLGVRRSFLPHGYDGACLFENLEMVRTVQAAGGRERVAGDVFVRRVPPPAGHFLSQRVRQAYDEWARPPRFAAQLAMLPLALLAAWRSPRILVGTCAAAIAVAEAGRRRQHGTQVFPLSASLMAPAWLAERMVCAWVALAARVVAGGVRYHGSVISKPATPMVTLVQRHAAQAGERRMERTS